MFKYTLIAKDIIIRDIKKYVALFKYAFLAINVGYYVFAIVTGLGYLWANIALLAVILLYFIFTVITQNIKMKTAKKRVKRTYKWIKIGIKAITLGATLYGIYIAANAVNPISIIITTLMIILWVLETLLEIISEVVASKIDLLIAGWKKDIEDIKKPVSKVGNFFRKLKGEEPIESDYDQSKIDILDNEINKKMNSKK